ncbi:MAG: hypothetical protein DMF84_29185 [Acidobacteria bacterium]|nr:MAG: hypothetical protein DMF84_29185 [Acidobacteriota bacterium]
MSAVRVTDPQLSPDGRLVAFVRTTTETTTGQRNADIWVVPADGAAAPKLLIGGEKSENTPRWSPDGREIAFISTRNGAPQVYIANAAGSNVAGAGGVFARRSSARLCIRCPDRAGDSGDRAQADASALSALG